MDADSSRVILTPGATSGASTVHHRDFPEIRAEGQTPSEAGKRLSSLLALALDTALTDWRRESLTQAVADVNAFLSNPK